MSKTLILKVLSGSQLGVEVGLPDGEYSFGSGSDAEIQFADLSMAPVHGQLRVAGGKVEIRATGAALQTASGLVIAAGDGEWREIAQLDRITAGTSIFAVGGADANWSSLASTPMQAAERRPEPSKPVTLNRNWLIGGGVIAASILAVLFLTGSGSNLPTATQSTPNETLKLVRSTLAGLPFDNELDVVSEADGTITVSGYVETGTERRAVQNALQDIGVDVRRRIWALEALRTDIAGLISSQEIDITSELKPDGELILSGVWLDEEAVTRTVGLLESEVFGLSKITNSVQTAADFLDETNALIAKLQLGELVLARLDGMLIEMTGVVPRDKMDNWVGFMRAYAGQIAPHMPLRSFVTLDGQPSDATVPVIIGAAESEASGGRVIAPDSVETETTDPENLFAQSESGAPVIAADAATEEEVTAATDAAPVEDPTLDAYEAMIDDYARQNPEVVAMLIRGLTNGQFSDIKGLREYFAAAATGQSVETAEASSLAGAEVSDPDAIVRILNTDDVATEPTDVAQPALAAAFDAGATVGRLNDAIRQLFDTSGDEAQLTPEAQSQNPELAAVSKEMIALAKAQSEALARGETLLVATEALGAEPALVLPSETCWAGSHITVESLPTVLLWMDILSISTNLDIAEVRPDSRLLFMEAALNPDRIRECLKRVDNDYGAALLANSEFLSEMARNNLFAAFLLRSVPRYPMDLAGINLDGERFAQLVDGRKLAEGAAPGVDSRLTVIGDLGLLIRVSDGYRVNLYDDNIGWLVSGM